MNTNVVTLCVCGWFALIALCAPAGAQAPAASFEELRSSLKLADGESIQITSEDGQTVKGKIAGISDRAITITVDGVRREMPESAVREIRHRQPDKWWNGALIGFGVGAGTGAVAALGGCSNDPECQVIATAVLVPAFGGIGAGAGALIDFAIRKHEAVYANPRTSSNRGMRVSPILSNDKKGVHVAFSF